MKITLAQLNFIVGDLTHNSEMILDTVRSSFENGVNLVIFSELAICGYPPLDLLEQKSFVENSIKAVEKLAAEIPENIGVILGAPAYNDNPEGKLLFNAAYFLYMGRIADVFRKSLLPTYDIFDEYRYFEPNREFHILEFMNKKIAVTICEDLWDDQPVEDSFSRSRLYTRHPLEELQHFQPDLIVNISASPFSAGKQSAKMNIFTDKAIKHELPLFMVNQVGANTELIFDGGSLAVSPNGTVYKLMNLFKEDYFEVELDQVIKGNSQPVIDQPDRIEMIHDALVLGIRDYFGKSGFKKATLGLSGGIDSAVTLALAERALGPANLHVLLMPSQYSSDHSLTDSIKMSETLGVRYDIIPIREIFDLFKNSLHSIFGTRQEDITEENIQSRIRGTLLMALSNKLGNILLNTSNKSETAVGYGTLYGDMAGGLSVLGDVYKVDVYNLARYINKECEVIPENIILKPPSAELRPNQKDSDSLPDYQLLDDILQKYIEHRCPAEEIINEGFEPKIVGKVISMVNKNEYKRYQTPPILRISSKAFGAGRRMPLVGKY